MDHEKIYLLLFSANLAFIATNIYGWILKEFHTAKPYREHFEKLFPAQRFVGLLYLAQLMEIPYLLMMGQPKALFYINAFSALYFSSMMVVIGEGYFFWSKYKAGQLLLYFLPMYVPVGWLLLAALGIVPATPDFYQWMFWVVCLVFLYYMIRVMVVQKKILSKVSEVVEGYSASDEGFPVSLSLRTRWLLLPVPLLMFGCFLCNDVYVKMGRDILFTVVNVWFLIYTIKPHRKIVQEDPAETIPLVCCTEPELPITGDELESEMTAHQPHHDEIQEKATAVIIPKSKPKYKLTLERCLELERQITDQLENEKIFLNPALTIDFLAQQLDSNKNYVSEAINRSRFGSYYGMINHFRIEHAIMMLRENPKQKVEHVSKTSGFSSTSVFSQVFKRSKGISPTQFIQELSAKTESE